MAGAHRTTTTVDKLHMAASYPARCTVDDHFNPRAIDIARTLDFVAVRRTEEKVMLGAWARANVQTAILLSLIHI